MKTFNYEITDEIGIHARPASMLVNEAKSLKSKIILSLNGKSAEATKLIAVMGLAAKKGMVITIAIDGEDEESAFVKMQKFFQSNL